MIPMAMTQAKTGRARKNLDMATSREWHGTYGHAGADLADAFHDYAILGGQPARDKPLVANCALQLQRLLFDLLVLAHHPRVRVPLRVAADSLLGDQHRLRPYAFFHYGADKHAGEENFPGIGEDHPQGNGAGAGIDGDVAELERPRHGIG